MKDILLEKLAAKPFNLSGLVAAKRIWRPGDRYSYLSRPRKSNGLLLLENTRAFFETPDGKKLEAEKGDVLLLPKGTHYLLTFPKGPKEPPVTLLINFSLSDEDGNIIRTGNGVRVLCRDEGSLLPLFLSAAELYGNGSNVFLKAKVFSVFGELTSQDAPELSGPRLLFKENESVSSLAKQSGMSEQTYRRLFRQKNGVSPKKQMIKRKLEKARRMIDGGDLGFAYISDSLGFCSLPYFYKVFKEHTGMTPGEYREKVKTK